MKKLFVVLAILTLTFAMTFATTSIVYAEELPPVDEVAIEEVSIDEAEQVETNEEVTIDELKTEIKNLVSKVKELSSEENVFKKKILPYLLSGLIDIVLVGIMLLKPYLKSKSKSKQLEGFAQALQKEKDNLTNLLSSTDAPAIKNALAELFGNYIDKMMKDFKSEFGTYLQTFVSIKTTIDTEYSQIKNLIEAARQAWASKPEVVALLATSPEKSTLEAQAIENEKLKKYIRELKGEEAEKIIKDLGE